MLERGNHNGRAVPNGPFLLNFEEHTCILPDGNEKDVTPLEMRVLSRLSPDEFRSTRDIRRSVAFESYPQAQQNESIEPDSLMSDDHLYVIIMGLRKKLGKQYIKWKYHAGYRLESGI